MFRELGARPVGDRYSVSSLSTRCAFIILATFPHSFTFSERDVRVAAAFLLLFSALDDVRGSVASSTSSRVPRIMLKNQVAPFFAQEKQFAFERRVVNHAARRVMASFRLVPADRF